MRKVRPVVIVSRDDMGRLPLKVIVPLTRWQPGMEKKPWLVRIDPTSENGLTQVDAADTYQVRSISETRFRSRLGELSGPDLEKVAGVLAQVIGRP